MIKLKSIISHLEPAVYSSLEENLVKNKAENFLFLLQSYRSGDVKDAKICDTLKISLNSLYVLKSRLNDKIQEHLAGNIFSTKESLMAQLHEVPKLCYGTPRELAETFLLKLEQDLQTFDLHNELLVVYSALKKIHLYSEKYFHYSQLYNKHIAFSISLEKSEELLGNFTRVLALYDFSRSAKDLETLNFLRKSIQDHLALKESTQLLIIRNLMEIQLDLFCNIQSPNGSIDELLRDTEKIISNLPESSQYKMWSIPLDYLYFEYYSKTGRTTQIEQYYTRVNANFKTLMLYSNVCLCSNFFISKVQYLQQTNKIEELRNDYNVQILYDGNDKHTEILYGVYRAMTCYYSGHLKEAASILNGLLNINSFKDYFHINSDIKLSLAFIYMQLKEYDISDNIIKNIQRKIKAEKLDNYSFVIDLIKVFNSEIKGTDKGSGKTQDNFVLFTARNKNEKMMLGHLLFEFNKKYS